MNSLKSIIDSRLDLVKHFTDKSYCVCKNCGKEWNTKLVNGEREYDLKAKCSCGSKEYENKYLLENNQFVIQVFQDLVTAYKTEIHEYLVPSNLADKETQIRNHIKDIMAKIVPIVDSRINAIKAQYSKLAYSVKGKANLALQCELDNLQAYYNQYMSLQDDFKALVAFRHFETFCLYIDEALNPNGEDIDYVFKHSIKLFRGFFYYANSMILNKDVRFIEKQCFAGAGKSVTDCAMIAFIFGVDKRDDVLKVFGNADNVEQAMETISTIMCSKQYAKVFPYYAKFNGKEADMFPIFKKANGKGTLKIAGNTKLNLRIRSKGDKIDGVRAKYLFLDDITAADDTPAQYEKDIKLFYSRWFKRKYDLNKFFIIASGTTYSQDDLLSHLKLKFGVKDAKPSKVCKFTSVSKSNRIIPNGLSVFCVVYGLDEHDKSTYELKFPTQTFLEEREDDYRLFMAMTQQDPLPPEGAPFDYDNLPNLYGAGGIPHLPDRSQEVCRASLDPARKGKDFHSMPVIVNINGRMFLQDCIFETCPPERLPLKIIDMIEKHHIVHLDIENNTTTDLKQLIQKLLKERGINYCQVTDFYSYLKKDDKIREYETPIKSIYYPERDIYSQNSQMGQFMKWLTAYRFDKPPKHDDSVDSLANFAQRFILNKSVGSKVKSLSRRY